MKKYVENIINQELQIDFNMLVLRGVDESARDTGDIDVLVPSGMSNIACRKLIDRVRIDGWKLLGFRELDYLSTVIITNTSIQPDTAIKVDFFGGLEWYGVKNGLNRGGLFDKLNLIKNLTDGKPKAIATVTFLHKVMYAGRFNDRDVKRINPYLENIKDILDMPDLVNAGFVSLGTINFIKKWRIRFRISGYRRRNAPLWCLRILLRAMNSRIRYGRHFGRYVSLSGLDSSGKSIHLDRLISLYTSSGESPPKRYHITSKLLQSLYQTPAYKKATIDHNSPDYGQSSYGFIISFVRLSLYVVIFFALKVYIDIVTWRGKNVITDQSLIDIVANIERIKHRGILMPPWMLRMILPHGHYIFLSVNPEICEHIESKNTFEKFAKISSNYLSIFNTLDGNVIDANTSPDDVFSKIIYCIDSYYSIALQYRL